VTGETVVILSPGPPVEDDMGNEIPGAGPERKVFDALVAPRLDGDATGDGRSGVIVGFTVYLPGRTAIAAHDRLRIRGQVNEIVGEPGDWFEDGEHIGTEVATRRVEG
jgi:hypothetical protein